MLVQICVAEREPLVVELFCHEQKQNILNCDFFPLLKSFYVVDCRAGCDQLPQDPQRGGDQPAEDESPSLQHNSLDMDTCSRQSPFPFREVSCCGSGLSFPSELNTKRCIGRFSILATR